MINIYEEYNRQTNEKNLSVEAKTLEDNAIIQSQKNKVWADVNDIIKDLKEEYLIKNDMDEPDFIDSNSPNINKEKVEKNNFGDDGDNISSIERDIDNEGKQDKDSRILGNSLEVEDKNEEMKIDKNS